MDHDTQRPQSAGRRAPRVRLTERDHRLLAFAAEHRVILAAHVQRLLGISQVAACTRLRALTRTGYLRSERLLSGPACYLIDRRGLRAIGSTLPRPRDVDLASYSHDIGLAWLWLAADAGAFGALDGVASERQMRSHDGRAERGSEPLGVRLPGVGPRGGDRRHYPDLLLHTSTGHRVGVELELTPKSRTRREAILGAYAVDPRIDAVLYLVADRRIGRAIEASAAAVGISPMVQVQHLSFTRAPGATTTAGRMADRSPRHTAGIAAVTSQAEIG